MAEPIPTNPTNKTGGVPEEIAQSSAPRKAAPSRPPSLLEDGLAIGKGLLEVVVAFGKWCGHNPLGAVAVSGIAATLYYFFWVLEPFAYGTVSTAVWAWAAWNPEGDQSYGRMVPFIALALFYYHREALARAQGGGYALGLVPLLLGILLFVLSFRCLNPRMALASVPFLLYGGIRLVRGQAASRVILFACAFLVFMIPVAALEQATARLQFIITGSVGALSHFLGISILAVGTTLTATDGSFNFEIAEGCSGIRSLTAMAMLTAVFVHLTQDRLWKKVVIFGGSFGFAIIGNIGRIFSIVLLAKYYDPKLAAGLYHDYSAFLFFPVAILAMLFFAKILNLDLHKKTGARTPQPTEGTPAA